MIEVALRTLVMGFAQVGDRVKPSTEVGPVAADLPKIAYTLIGSPRSMTNSGPVNVVTARYQLDIFAATVTEARTIADRTRAALNGYRGTVDGTPIQLVRFDDDSFSATTPTAGANAAAARLQQDVFVTYQE